MTTYLSLPSLRGRFAKAAAALFTFAALSLSPALFAQTESPAPGANTPSPGELALPESASAVVVRPDLRLLTIGNSLTNDATAYLEAMAKAAGKNILVFRANLGGHSLEQHVKYITAYEKDPNDPVGHAYKKRKDPRTGEIKDFSLREALESETWDYVTLQQVTQLSFKSESYEPYASTLISYIQKYAPKAKILVHQTWAYRPDSKSLAGWKMSTEDMYNGLKVAYSKLAADYHLGIIPNGDAFRAASALPQWNQLVIDPNFDFKNPAVDSLPVESQSLIRGYYWKLNKKTGQKTFELDAKHATKDGRYLGVCGYYQVLFHEEPPTVAAYCPEGVKPADAEILRQVSIDTVKANNLVVPPATGAQAKLDAPAKK